MESRDIDSNVENRKSVNRVQKDAWEEARCCVLHTEKNKVLLFKWFQLVTWVDRIGPCTWNRSSLEYTACPTVSKWKSFLRNHVTWNKEYNIQKDNKKEKGNH